MRLKMAVTKTLVLLLSIALIAIVAGCNTKPRKEGKERAAVKQQYRCPMHHEIVRDKPGTCPICGMDLVAFGGNEEALTDVSLNILLKPANNYVLSSVPVVSIQQSDEQIEIPALGTIQYDTRGMGGIAARVTGRIEKLYLRYTFQDVRKGQKVMDIYSPELLTAQQNLLFLIKNDAANTAFISAAKEKLLLLGMGNEQLQQVIQSQKPSFTIPVYSNYEGHIHDALNTVTNASMAETSIGSNDAVVTRDLALKEGMYVQKGQTVLTVMNPHKLWAVLNIYMDDQSLVKPGNPVRIIPESSRGDDFRAKIDFIEPFFRQGSKTLTARVFFENHLMNLPVGSQVKATIFGNNVKGNWLPKDAVISLGLDKVVFKKQSGAFKATKVTTGLSYDNKIQIIEGLSPYDAVAANAQFLMDSESFIKVNE